MGRTAQVAESCEHERDVHEGADIEASRSEPHCAAAARQDARSPGDWRLYSGIGERFASASSASSSSSAGGGGGNDGETWPESIALAESPSTKGPTRAPAKYAPAIGDVIAGKYRLEKVAGEGGMGIVYAAEHLVLQQRVAVKVLLPSAAQSEAVVERFEREARVAAKIVSEHVARVMDAGSLANGAPFLVMEYLEGCNLEDLLAIEGSLPIRDVVDYVLQTCEALAHAHAVGIVHRDLKPANLFLAKTATGGSVIKVVDFGISKSMKASPEEKRLTGQHVLGSPVYMSPEQLRNAKTIDPLADVWSLGIVAYELLTGVPPFDGDGVGEIFAAILEQEPPPLDRRTNAIPPELAAVVLRCIRRNPAERWEDVAQLASAIAPFGSGKYNAVVERCEQVLLRAKRLEVSATPAETRLVVEAIEAAALRARSSTTAGTDSAPALPLVARRAEWKQESNESARVAPTQPSEAVVRGAVRSRIAAVVRDARGRSPGVFAGATAALLAVFLLGFAVVRGAPGAAAAPRVDVGSSDALQGAAPTVQPVAVITAPSASALAEGTLPDEHEDDEAKPLPPPEKSGTPVASPRPVTRSASGLGPNGRPQRPKFLNSRE